VSIAQVSLPSHASNACPSAWVLDATEIQHTGGRAVGQLGDEMKIIQILGVAAIAALALVVATTASAVTMCKQEAKVCPEAQRYAAGTIFKFHASKAVVKGSLTATCESNIEGKLDEASGNPLKVEVVSPTYAKCEGCTELTATGWPATGLTYWSILWGLILVHELKAGVPGVVLKKCAFGVECKFQVTENEEKPASAVLRLEGGKPATLGTGGGSTKVVKMIFVGGNEALCGKTATIEATYTQTSPETGVWVAEEP
jgi:hypothetical protein